MPKAQPIAAPTAAEVVALLQGKAAENVRKIYLKQGSTRALGVMMGELRKLANAYKKQHELGLALWETGWFEARVLATMILDPKQLDEATCIRLAESCDAAPELDKLSTYVLEASKHAAALRARWQDSDDPLLGRAGWHLMTAEVQADKAGKLDLDAILAKVEAELPAAPTPKKEAMNQCLVMVGVYHPAYTEKAIEAGHRIGRWDTRPVPKGCTSSYPAEWIPAAIRLREVRKR